MQQKSIQLKYVNKKSLHEINFVHNDCLDSVFIQQHMHTFIFMTAFGTALKCCLTFIWVEIKWGGVPRDCKSMIKVDKRMTMINHQPVRYSMIWAWLLTDFNPIKMILSGVLATAWEVHGKSGVYHED